MVKIESDNMEVKEQQKFFCSSKFQHEHEFVVIDCTHLVVYDTQIVMNKSLKNKAAAWYNHYLKHPGHKHMEEMLKATLYGPKKA